MNPDRIERQINIRQDGEGNTQFNIFDSPSPPKYKPRYGLPYPPSTNFVEPEGALKRLHDRLQIGSCAIAAVVGMAGVGKTELALQYAAKYGETYEGGCYWLGLRDHDLADVLAQHIKTEFQQEVPLEILEQGERTRWCWKFWERHLPKDSAVLTVLDNMERETVTMRRSSGTPSTKDFLNNYAMPRSAFSNAI
jgi:hypothetical protein